MVLADVHCLSYSHGMVYVNLVHDMGWYFKWFFAYFSLPTF